MLTDAAQASLEALAAPVVGAWAAQWTAAGLDLDALDTVAERLTAACAESSYAQQYRRAFLRRLSRLHAPHDFKPSRPARLALDLDTLPLLSAYRASDPARGLNFPHFLDGEGKAHTLPAGLDALTLTQPDGGAVLIFTGFRGHTDFERLRASPPGFRVPARLLGHVRALMAGEHPPELGPAGGQA